MFGIGATEMILILVVALLVFGPKRLPDLARSLGKGMAEFRRASNDLRQTLQDAEREADVSHKPPEASNRIAAPEVPSEKSREPAPEEKKDPPEQEGNERGG